ncbi:hypothetical protein PRZ48_012165 [Zasmidium cellare]|uniref:SPX domain-containing protein n=1 Tax=Zasmidium cellare TaxID=395010 RepID=A0ABR0E466_ZASCE|nr:hypothetical protein PRZ48_012165 [Zasmidium cellare]
MKYGKTLRQRSVPAWNCYNIEYDKIKYYIKEQTTPGNGKAVAIPGRGEIDKALEFEDTLHHILAESYANITLFVKSKSGEIRSRLAQNEKQLAKLATRPKAFKSNRIPLSELQAYACIEKDVIRAGQDIESLSRFISAQRTAFRKLLKKYRKWTGSTTLDERFNKGVFDDPKGFNRFDAGPLLDTYSTLLHTIRVQYGKLIGATPSSRPDTPLETITEGSATIRELQDELDKEQKSAFDTSMLTVPLGKHSTFASYFVHPENVMELEVFLMQYAKYYLHRSRNNSLASQIHDLSKLTSFTPAEPDVSDFHTIAADDVDRFLDEQRSLKVEDLERRSGSIPQRTRAALRWSEDELAMASLRTKNGKVSRACMSQKNILDFFSKDEQFHAPLETAQGENGEAIERLRSDMMVKDNVRPLYHFASCRSRFVGLEDGEAGLCLATLDTNIRIDKADAKAVDTKRASKFPFGVLTVRQEGFSSTQLLSILDESHLVERVPGFSLEYHCIWELLQSEKSIPAPAWKDTLQRDIRKIPKTPPMPPRSSSRQISGERSPLTPPPVRRSSAKDRLGSGVGLRSAGVGPNPGAQTLQTVMSPHDSNDGTVDSGTAVEQSSAESHLSALENPPLRAFRKKKRPNYPEAPTRTLKQPQAEQQRYWNEYDNPEEGGSDEGGYAIYVDPYEASPLERAIDNFFSKIGNLFKKQWPAEEEPLLPSDPVDEESSDDELATATTPGFGTFASTAQPPRPPKSRPIVLTHLASASLIVSAVFLLVGYILSATGKHKLVTEVRVGVVLCVVCGLAAALAGFRLVVLRSQRGYEGSAWMWWGAFAVLMLEAVGAGGLLVGVFG